jgi:hypothetical protein
MDGRRWRIFFTLAAVPRPLGAYHKAEIEKWWPIIKSGNVKADADR